MYADISETENTLVLSQAYYLSHPLSVCVCVCTCMCTCGVCVHMQNVYMGVFLRHVPVEARGLLFISPSTIFQFIFRDTVLHWTWCLPFCPPSPTQLAFYHHEQCLTRNMGERLFFFFFLVFHFRRHWRKLGGNASLFLTPKPYFLQWDPIFQMVHSLSN